MLKLLGQRLQDERKRRNLTLEEVAAAIKIRSEFLSAIEKGAYDRLPSPAYAQGFVSNYGVFLGFSKRETLALFRREFDEQKAYKVLPKGMVEQEKFHHKTFRMQRTTISIIAILIFLVVYLAFQYRSVFFGPPLSVDSPNAGSTVHQDVQVKGSTDPTAVVAVNGDIVSVDENGNFVKNVTLLPGKSDIQVVAKNREGKTTTLDRLVNVKN